MKGLPRAVKDAIQNVQENTFHRVVAHSEPAATPGFCEHGIGSES